MPIKSGPTPESMAELQAAVLAMKVMDKELRSDVNKETRSQGNDIWRRELAGNASTTMDQLVLVKGGRVAAGNPPRLLGATSRRPLSGGLVPDSRGKGFEFGTKDRDKFKTYDRRSKNGGSHKVSRRTRRQLPEFTAQGRVIWPAVASTMPRMVSLWTQTIVRKVHEKFEGK